MQEHVGVVDFGRRQRLAAGQAHGMNDRIDLASPEIEKLMDAWVVGRQVEGLPDETLQQRRMVRHVIEHFGRRQPPSVEAQYQLVALHIRCITSNSRTCPLLRFSLKTGWGSKHD